MADNLSDGYIYVSYNHMANAADDMVMQTKAISETLSNLEAELNELSKTWYGTDADEYHRKQKAWHGAVEQMKMLLNSNGKLLQDIHDAYSHSEKSLSQMWSEVTIGR
ncbi:WXG100 family type VII secretion target [Streptomyces jietaisiensis]|uniref:WXG100 family type VII secretion target n=1 Tax=Streptomyces griseoaurantiacus TaxID=68213 RepID=UPI0032561537